MRASQEGIRTSDFIVSVRGSETREVLKVRRITTII